MSKKYLLISLFVVFGKLSSGQENILNCFDTLYQRLMTDTVFTGDRFGNWNSCIKDKQFPNFSVETITGKKIKIKQFRGKVLVVNLWFMACAPCMAELPALNRLVKEYQGKDVAFIGFGTDTKKHLLAEFLPKYKFDFIIVPYDKDVIHQIGITGYPATYIIDKKGRVQAAWVGGSIGTEAETWAYFHAKPIIDELLKQKTE